jgi:DNA polymerase III delta subunit
MSPAARGGGEGGRARAAGGAKREAPPHRQVEQFVAELAKARQLPTVTLLRGEETFFLRQALEALTAKAAALGVEVLKHDEGDPDFDPALLFNDLSTAPLFGGEQLLLLRSLDKLTEKRGKQEAPLLTALDAFLAAATPGRALVLEAPGLRADHGLCKRVAAAGGTLLNLRRLWDSPPPWNPDPRQSELVQWCLERARQRRLPLDPDRAVSVVLATGNDLAGIDAQLERLGQAGPGAFAETLVWQAGGSPFAVAQAALSGRTREALSGVEVLFRRGMTDRSGEKKLDLGALVALLNGALIGGARQAHATLAARESGAEPPAFGGGPRAQEELEERLRARPKASTWAALLEDLAELDRQHKRGRSADADEYARLLLRWALRHPLPSRPAAPRRG